MTEPTPQPELTIIPLPSSSPERFIYKISNLLTPEECKAIIEAHQDLVPLNVTIGTIRNREIFEDPVLAETLFSRLAPFISGPSSTPTTERNSDMIPELVLDESEEWRIKGLNEVWRLARYDEGGKFVRHQDGRRLASVNSQSFMTINIYLNTVPDDAGGATRFLKEEGGEWEVISATQPVLGTGVIFRDDVWHDGAPVLSGEKFLLRTDIMYERVKGLDVEELGLSDQEKGWKALQMAEGLEDAGNYDEAVKWYKKAYKLWPRLERGL